jgi:hypothetical protein
MNRYLVELRTLCDWQSRLGDPVLHWKRGASAMEVAIQWTMASVRPGSGLPKCVEQVLKTVPGGDHCSVKLAIPELQTELDGKGKPSQTDLWVLLNSAAGLLSLSVEAKADESFGEVTGKWLDVKKDEGRWVRLRSVCAELGLDADGELVKGLMYQLLHRTVATLKEAREWKASAAVMLVQCFGEGSHESERSWRHFSDLCAALGADSRRGELSRAVGVPGPMPLWIGWLDCTCASDRTVADVLGQSRSSLRSQLSRGQAEPSRADSESMRGDAIAE